jgi:hypothetical protein
MVKVSVAVFPTASVAVHITVVVPTGNKPGGGSHDTLAFGSLRSSTLEILIPTLEVLTVPSGE